MGPVRIAASQFDVAVRSEAICGESPMWSAGEQVLYWVDNVGERVHRFDPGSGHDEAVPVEQNVMDLGLRAGGGLVAALAKQLAFYDSATGALEPFAEVERDRPDNRFNDGKLDRRGRYWAGSMDGVHWDRPAGALYRLGGDLRPELIKDEVVCANGLGWSPDDRVFYLGESFRHTIFAYDFDADDGAIANRRPLATVDKAGGGFPDGLTVDAEGGVWSAHNGAGRLVRYAADGTVTHIAELPVPHCTSVIFGGADLDVLYVTSARQGMDERQLRQCPLSGSVFAVRPGISGLPEPLFHG
ncbi:MAG: SMP-30/gluconolactonase/LRE family protein [Trebonia sp.]